MEICLVTAKILAVMVVGIGPEDLTAASLEQDRRVRIEIAPPVGGDNPTTRLVDGNTRTSHFASTQIKWPEGATPSVTIDLRGPRLITRVEVGYAGQMRLTGIDRRARGSWSALPANLFEDRPAKYPRTSWLIAKGASVPAEALRLRWRVGSKGGQLTEVRVLGERSDQARAVGYLAVMPCLPVAHKTAEVMVDLRNPGTKAKRSMSVRCVLRNGQGRQVAVAGPVAGEVAPLRASTVRTPMKIPGPGRYELTASVEGSGNEKTSTTVHVLGRELQFIWYGVPEQAQWVTMLTTVSGSHEIERWQRRGVVPLGWSGGYCYRDKYDEDGFAEYWTGGLKGHPVGIAVDEFGNHYGKPTDLQMSNGLLRAHRAVPDKRVVIWQAGVTPPEAAEAYRIAADWIILECYMNYFDDRFSHFDARINQLRKLGLIHKSVMGLCCTSDKIGTTAEGMVKQVRYVRRKAPEMPGLGFYKAYGTGKALAPVADRLCYEYFIKPTILAEPCPRAEGRVLLRNIGALPGSGIDVVFEKYERRSLKVIQTDRIERIEPDAVADVRLDTDRSGKGRFTFRVKPSEAYSCVSPPLRIDVSGE